MTHSPVPSRSWTKPGFVAYSRYAPHSPALRSLCGSDTLIHSRPELATAEAGHVRALRRLGARFVLWEWAPDEVLEAWGEPDLVVSNGFFPHYSTLSWDRQGWVATAEWPKRPLVAVSAEEQARVERWAADYRDQRLGDEPWRAPDQARPFLFVVLQIETDLVARWWPKGRDSQWLIHLAQDYASREGFDLVVKQHPFDPVEPDAYDVDRARTCFLSKDAFPLEVLSHVNASLVSQAHEVWGFNSTMVTEAALIYDKPTRAFGPTLLDGHGLLLGESPEVVSGAPKEGLTQPQRRAALLSRLLSRQVALDELHLHREAILSNRERTHDVSWPRSA